MFGQSSLDSQSGMVGPDEESERRRMDDAVTIVSQPVSESTLPRACECMIFILLCK